MAPLGYQQTMQVWVNACGSNAACVAAAPIAAAITFPESGNDPSTVEQNVPYSQQGWGLWQITPGNSEPQFGIDNALLNPQANANAAVAKWEGAGGSFRPWTTYTGGEYLKYLQAGVSIPSASSSSQASSSTSTSGTAAGSTSSDYGIGAFGSGLAASIAGAGDTATQSVLGVGLVLVGVAVLAVALWFLAPQGTRDAIKSTVASAARTAVMVIPK